MGQNELLRKDWLNKSPLFFNTVTGKSSFNITEVIDFNLFDWDWEGLKNFLDYGYSVFGHTPIKNVRFLLSNQTLETDKGKPSVIENEDLFLEEYSKQPKSAHPDDLHQQLYQSIKSQIEIGAKICLPLSGGYDSRYIAAVLYEMGYKNISCFSFGVSRKQDDSFEVVLAKEVAKRLGFSWQTYPFKSSFKYSDDWYQKFGVSTHLHGTHQLQFYNQIYKKHGDFDFCLSGLVGDAWTGKVEIGKIASPTDLQRIGLTHGLNANSKFMTSSNLIKNKVAESYFSDRQTLFTNHDYRLVETIRNKMMLLRYLEVVPNSFGMKTISPFTELNFVIKSLSLPQNIKTDRKWQVNYFKKNNLFVEESFTGLNHRWEAFEYMFLRENKEPLNPNILKEIYSESRVKWINRNICNGIIDKAHLRLNLPFRGRRILMPFIPKSEHRVAFCEYLTLLPLQKLIIERNEIYEA